VALGVVVAAMLPLPAPAAAGQDVPADEEIVITVFHGAGCPHCSRAFEFFDGLEQRWPEVRLDAYEVWENEANQVIFARSAAEHGIEPRGVPTIFLADRYWVGFSAVTGEEIEAAVAALHAGAPVEETTSTIVDVPIVGPVDLGGRSMLAATVLIGFADGLNPCSLWALSILLALVLHSGSRRRVLVVGTTFLAVTSALYGAYMVGAYSALQFASEMTWIRTGVAAVAGLFGFLQLRSYWNDQTSPLSIPDSRKPSLYGRMRSLGDPDRSLPAVLGGTVVLAAGVSLVETPCTAGLPLLWTDLLADRDVSGVGAAVLFGVYLGVFLLDELALFLAAVLTMRAAKLQERHGRALHLIGGTLMVTLAATMLVAPDRLESVAGTFTVVAAAGILAGLLHSLRRGSLSHVGPG
jgi:cytochrome c biogenesis protein CcdA/glutaredoxin